MGIHDVWLFVAAAGLLAVTPGPDMALIVARAGRYGFKGGLAATLGVAVGAFVHIFAAAIGVSAMLIASATAFNIIKWAGAAYLIYMGATLLLARASAQATTATDRRLLDAKVLSMRQIFWQGALSNILNPKVAVFFLALLPQFVDANAPSTVQAFLVLGVLLDAIGTLWNVLVAWFAARLVSTGPAHRGKVWLERSMGAFFLAIGARLAFVERG